MVMKNIYKDSEHPFAQYVRILGKGKSGSRSLSFEEAQTAFGMILTGDVLDAQLGAFLMLLRVKEESPQELAGFVNATREWLNAPCIDVDLDWSSYAGKRKHYPWFLLAALILAENGYGSLCTAQVATLSIDFIPKMYYRYLDTMSVVHGKMSKPILNSLILLIYHLKHFARH